MRTLFVQTLRRGLSPLLLAGALAACGPNESQDGPVSFDGSVTISRTSETIVTGTVVAGACNGIDALGTPFITTGPYIITVFDAEGRPVGNADLQITLELAPNTTFGGTPTTQLVDSVIVTNVGSAAPYNTTTDDDGTKQVFILFEITTGCSYAGVMTVVSGSVVTQLDFQTAEM
jgi:hypothetical protein